MPGNPALRVFAAGPRGAPRAAGPGAAVGGAGRTGCWAPWRQARGAGQERDSGLRPAPGADGRGAGGSRAAVPGSGFGREGRSGREGPAGAASNQPPGRDSQLPITARPGHPRPAASFVPSCPGGPRRRAVPAARLPASALRLLARADPVVCTRVCAGSAPACPRAHWAPPPGTGFPVTLHTHAPAAVPGTAGGPWPKPQKSSYERMNFDHGWGVRLSTGPQAVVQLGPHLSFLGRGFPRFLKLPCLRALRLFPCLLPFPCTHLMNPESSFQICLGVASSARPLGVAGASLRCPHTSPQPRRPSRGPL